MNEERPDETAPHHSEETRRFAAPTPAPGHPPERDTPPGGVPPQTGAGSGRPGQTWAALPSRPGHPAPQSGQQQPYADAPHGGPQPSFSGEPQQQPGLHRPGTQQPGPQPYGSYPQGQQPALASNGHPSGSGGYPPVATTPSRRGSRAAVPLAALLAAILASGGTYALTHDGSSNEPTAAGNTTVVQGNPADYADAGTVNWSATAGKVTPSVVSITSRGAGGGGGRGSGVVLDDKGNIATNNHVVAGSEALEVTLADNRTFKAKIVGTDPSTDLAVIRLENPPSGLKPISFGDDDKLAVGQPVMAVGNPLGLASTVTTGIVSALNRPVSTQQQEDRGPSEGDQPPAGGEEVVTNAIQTSAAINPGNSGGALVTGTGKLIGINSSIATLSGSSAGSQGGNIGIGFAIPVTVVKNITGQLIASGKAKHAQLGVTATNGSAKEGGATVSGAKVASVVPDSGADKAGLKKDDVILKIDGEAVESSTSLVGQVRERTAGQRVALTVVRDGERQNVTVTLGTAPSS